MNNELEIQSQPADLAKWENVLSRYGPLAITVFTFIIYISTIHNRVTNSDCGELAAAAYKLGVAHPTGYPLYTLLGHLFTYLPFPSEVAGRVAVMSSVFGAATVYVVFQLTKSVTAFTLKTDPREWKTVIPALLASLTYALSPVVWRESRIVEVYSLHALLMSLCIWFLLRFEQTGQRRYVSLAAIPIALGFAHHMTTSIILFSTFFYILIKDVKFIFSKYLLWGLLAGVGGALFYLYLPIADIYTKGFPWGATSDPKMFWDHVTGQPYHYLLFGNWERTIKHFYETPTVFWSNFFLLTPMIFFGMFAIARKHKAWMLFNATYLILAMVHLLSYNVRGYKAYYVAPFIVVAIFSGVGTSWITGFLYRKIGLFHRNRIGFAVMMLFFVGILIFPANAYIEKWKEFRSESPFPRDYGIEATSLPPGSILLQMGDTYTHAAWYYQEVHNKGWDVALITSSLLKRSWYEKWVKKRWPWFAIEVTKFHRRNVERTLKRYYGKRRIFTRNCGEKKKWRPRGPYKLVCRGWIYEFIKQPKGNEIPVYVRNATLTDALRSRKPYSSKRAFDLDDNISLTFIWGKKTKKGIRIEWSTPDGKVFSDTKLIPNKNWVSLPLENRNKGLWYIRGFVNKELILEIPFEIL